MTPKINCKGRNGVDPNLIFGIDSKLFLEPGARGNQDWTHNDEVETITVYRGPSRHRPHGYQDHHVDHHAAHSIEDPASVQGSAALSNGTDDTDTIDINDLTKTLGSLSRESVWRVKGFVRLNEGVHILNWAFGRFDLTKLEGGKGGGGCVRFTVMGERGEVKRACREFVAALRAVML